MTAEDENLDLLLSLFEESNGQNSGASVAGEEKDNLDNLFDDDGDEGEDYAEPEEEEEQDMESANSSAGGTCELNKSKEDLEEELRSMQEKMQKLQQQLEASQKSAVPQPRQAECNPSSRSQSSKPSPATQHSPKHLASLQQRSKPALQTHSSTRSPPTAQRVSALSPPQQAELKQRTAHQPKAASSENQSVLGKGVSDRLSQPARNSAKINDKIKSPPPNKSAGVAPPIARQATPRPSVTQDATVEKFSGLRLRRPRLSSVEIEHKMANRRMIKLSQLPDRLARDNLEDSDWVTFAVVISKITPQSKNNGKTFSIWKLNDLHNLEVNVSLFLFGTVHTDLWKTDTGTVIGILNPNQMKNKDGANELSLTVDHPQKVLILGEAMDFGTCKAKKKNGDSCTQLVNLYECQFCQYHVKAQYKKMSSKRAELQSSFTGSAPGKRKGQGGLRERLCQSDFHYGGMSSLACAPSITAPQPKKQPSIQTVLASIPSKKLGLAGAGEVSGCSDDFKSLMSMPTPGALNIKRHLGQAKSTDSPGSTVQSISAIDLLKQQKELHKQRLQARQKRAEEIQKRVLQNTGGAVVPARPSLNRGSLHSQKASPETKGSSPPERRLSAPPVPTLGRGFMEGEDILLDMSPPPPSKSLSAAKMAAVRKLQAKGVGIVKDDPNSVKRKRPSSSEINTRVQRNLTSPEGETTAADVNDEEPAHKKRREQLEYIQSEEFQRILNARSSNSWIMGEVEAQTMQDYFEPLVQKEKLEEKMKNIREMKCRAVTCKNCKYTHFKPADRCVEEKHDYHWHDAVKRFFKCPCGQRKISLGRLPNAACSNCGLFKWERDGMLKEKNGPKIGGELLLPRGEEQPRFLNSMK